jgi:UDP-N-acetylglucosamine 4,6-dehydratase/5-epimerase
VFNDKKILVTGGTGSFGRRLIARLIEKYRPQEIVVYSRDELKQFEMRSEFPVDNTPVRYFIGDIRDKERLYRVCHGVDYIVHAAALKQVPTAEFNPTETIKTNIIGSENVIEAALENHVDKVIALSTDKACNPINLYGATKLASDKLFAAANHWQGSHSTVFSVVRYGNVVGSRGSVIPYFFEKKKSGILPITDERMTRFWITLTQGVDFVLRCFDLCRGGELFVPKIPSMNIMDLASVIAPDIKYEFIGIRPGEKLHEIMISKDDAINTLEFNDYYVIQPAQPWWDDVSFKKISGGTPVVDSFEYSSDQNPQWLTKASLKAMLSE